MTQPTHSMLIGYLFWLLGFFGLHRFYYGRQVSGIIWFFTFGLLLIGWIVDLLLIPGMQRDVEVRFRPGPYDYNLAWLLLVIPPLGVWGVHRFYQGKILTGILWLLTFGLFGVGIVYDVLTLNEQINELNYDAGGIPAM